MFDAADEAADARHNKKAANESNNELVALVQVSSSCDEDLLQGRLKSFGVAWCNSVDNNGRYLVRFLTHDGLEAAAKALHGSSWLGQPFCVEPLSVGQLQPAGQESGLTPRADSIPTMQLTEDYFSEMLQDEQQQQDNEQEQQARPAQQSTPASAFEVSALQDLEPCDAEWIPTAAADSSILGPLEDDPLSNDASPLQSFTRNTSTCQLWSQRSIGAVARKDLAKFAAMQHMAQQHSCNSPTQASLLAAGHHVLGLGSTWSSAHSMHSSSSLASLALTAAGGSSIFQDGVRRSSSPSGQLKGHSSLPCAPTATTPRSPFHAAGEAGGFGSGLQQPQQQLNLTRSGSAGQNVGPASSLTLNLPLELGLGDSASALADEEVMRVHNMAAARQQQQQQGASSTAAGQSRPLTIRTGPQHGSGLACSLPNFAGLLSSYGSEGASSPLGGQTLSTEGSGGFLAAGASGAAGGSSRFAGGASGSFGSGNGLGTEAGAGYPGSPHGLGLVPPPPPPPPQGQPGTPGTPPGGLLGQQPPPPPPPGGSRTPPPPALDSYSGSPYEGASRTGAISPVQPAPPPRAITPGATWQGPGSGNCSPRLGGLSQPQSPSNGYRGPPRAAGLRGFQHGMSNLGQHSGSYDSYGSQPPPYGRVGSPVTSHRAHSPCGVPPPPPPSTHVTPGYVAAATAAATACGPHVSPAPSPPPPAGLGPRSGSTCGPSGAPVSNVSTPTGRAAAETAATSSTSASASGSASAGVNAADASDAISHLGQQGATKAQQDTAAGSERTTNSRKQQQQQQQQQLKADGVLFVEELLQLLKQPGATAGNPFLANLTDLLDCALSTSAAAAGAAAEENGKGSGGSSRSNSGHSSGSNSRRASSDEQKSVAAAAAAVLAANGSAKVPLLPMAAITESLNKTAGAGSSHNTPRTARGSNGGRESSRGGGRRGAGSAKQVPVDAAAFLGMLQEAAAPLLAAAAAAAATQRFSNAGMAGQGRRPGQQRGSSGGYDEACGSNSRGQSQGGDARGSKAGGLRGSTVGLSAGSNSSSNAQQGVSEAGASAAEGALGNSGGSSDLSSLPLNLLLRHSLAGGLSKGGSGPQSSQLLFPLHPRTTTHSSCGGGGTAPGTPLGTPMLLVPQTVPELLSTRAALIRLLLSAHAFVHGPVYARMASRLSGIEELYDSMHEDPVVVKRRKCRDMAAMRDVIKRDTAFSQAVLQVSSMRSHIYSLSRKVLIGFGHMESLPIDLLLGGLTTELAAILAEPCDPQQLGQIPAGSSGSGSGTVQATPLESRASNTSSAGATATPAAGGSSTDGSAAAPAAAAAAAADTGGIVLPQHVADFFTTALPVPKLALLVFVEFVPVDPAPCSTSLPPSGLGTPDAWTPSVNGSNSGSGSGSGSHGGGRGSHQHNSTSRDHRRSSNEHTDLHSHGGSYQGGNGNGTPRNRSGHHGRWGHGRDRDMGHSNGGGGRMRDSHGGGSNPNTPRRGSRGGSYSNGGASNGGAGNVQQDGGKRNSSRRSGHGGFDLVAEAAALVAAASAAAPLVAAAVCDLPPGNRRQGSNAGSSS